jgi:hypothetical protein
MITSKEGDEMISTSDCDLRVVLLCKGPGADPNSFRPNRDDSQWWGRRDALVRCVSSFLFGPKSNVGQRELLFLFDDDLARMSMRLSKTCRVVPTEKAVVSLWKKAAQKLNCEIEANGMICKIDLDLTTLSTGDGKGASSGGLPTGLDSKRQVLEYLQKYCPLEFLKTKGLNSNLDTILRKTNRKSLISIFNDWENSKDNKQKPSLNLEERIESMYTEILLKPNQNGPTQAQVVAGTLHEMFQEFPCFGLKDDDESSSRFQLCLFLGAVRDMTSKENKILQNVCKKTKIALVGIRFGIVPEFTSKILSILAYHHSKNAVGVTVERLLRSSTGQKLGEELSFKPQMYNLVVICTVPLPSTQISTDLKYRGRVHWCLVRIIVCTLWRSKLVSADLTISHSNSLHLIFDDGVTVYLKELEFVKYLAGKHQAAPCEYQILQALLERIKLSPSPEREWSKKRVASKVIKGIMKASSQPSATFFLGIDAQGCNHISQQFYTNEESHRSESRTVVTLLDIGGQRCTKPRKIERALFHAAEKSSAVVLKQTLVRAECEDYEAATIIALQHFCYQNRVFTEPNQGTKRKRCNSN